MLGRLGPPRSAGARRPSHECSPQIQAVVPFHDRDPRAPLGPRELCSASPGRLLETMRARPAGHGGSRVVAWPTGQMNHDDSPAFLPIRAWPTGERPKRRWARQFVAADGAPCSIKSPLSMSLTSANRAHRRPAVERSDVDDLGPLQQLIQPSGSNRQDDLFLLNLQVVVISRGRRGACLA